MKTRICLFLMMLLSASGIGQNIIPIDLEAINGTTPNAIKVLEKAEAKLAEIHSVEATVINIRNSTVYGHDTIYTGQLKFDFDGKAREIGAKWWDSHQSNKGRNNHFRGTLSSKGMKELFLLKKKMVYGGPDAYPKARIQSCLNDVYWNKRFFTDLKECTTRNKNKDEALKYNVLLEGIEAINGVDCYVIKTYRQDMTNHMERYYFGVKDFYYYGSSRAYYTSEVSQEIRTMVVDLKINSELADFDITKPEGFTEEPYVSHFDIVSLSPGAKAPAFELEDSEGKIRKLSDYRGQVVLLDFWATWCGPCKAKMPKIQELHENYKDKGLKVISILTSDKGHEQIAKEYLDRKGYTFSLLHGNDDLANTYKIKSLPTVYIISKNGEILLNTSKPRKVDSYPDILKILEEHL